MYDIYSGYYTHRSIPLRYGSREAYVMQSLEYRQKCNETELNKQHKPSRLSERLTYSNHSASVNEEDVRKDFVFKMYFLLSVQYSVILGIVAIFAQSIAIEAHLKHNYTLWIFTLVAGVLLYLSLVVCPFARSSYPLNFVLISMMILCLAVTMGSIVVVYEIHEIIYTVAIEMSIVYFATIITKLGQCDAASCAMIFCVTFTGLIIYFVVGSIIWIFTRAPVTSLLFCGITTSLYTMYLLFNTQFMLEDSSSRRALRGDFIKGNIHLWTDLVLMSFYGCGALRRKIFNRTIKAPPATSTATSPV